MATRRRNAKAAARKTRSNPRKLQARAQQQRREALQPRKLGQLEEETRKPLLVRNLQERILPKNPDVAQDYWSSVSPRLQSGSMVTKMNAHGAQKWGSQKLTQKP